MILEFPLLMLCCTFLLLLLGFPVAFSLGGAALIFGGLGYLTGDFQVLFLSALPGRIFGIMRNETLLAIPLFVFMGLILQKAKISEDLLVTMAGLFGKVRGGLGVSVILVGALLAASTGIVGATVVTMGILSLPLLLKNNYPTPFSTGLICASGTLGQIIPPSIVLVVLGDVLGTAYQQSQLDQGIFDPKSLAVGDLFVGALVPGFLLVAAYILYTLWLAWRYPGEFSPLVRTKKITGNEVLRAFLAPVSLVVGVLGSILLGLATPTEAASIGGVGALALATVTRRMNWNSLREAMDQTTHVSAMVFSILIGASLFSLVFRGFEGDEWIAGLLVGGGSDPMTLLGLVMGVVFILGFFLDFFEITFVVIPIVGPGLLSLGLNPIWLGILVALNLQTSFLTPPFGFSLFYLRGVLPSSIKTREMYRGVLPFIGIQILIIGIVFLWPSLVTWLPNQVLNK